MNTSKTVIAACVAIALGGCGGHQQASKPIQPPAQSKASLQANENALHNMLSGKPILSSHMPSIADYSLSGYGTSPAKSTPAVTPPKS